MVFVMITMSAASERRISEVLNEKPDLTEPDDPIMDIPDGSIDFDHVSFSYAHGDGEETLHDIDLHIKSGETIGIIGGTGSGKSSLVSLVSRLYDVDSGEVRVGGIDVRRYDIESLRDAVAVVLQKNVLFSERYSITSAGARRTQRSKSARPCAKWPVPTSLSTPSPTAMTHG